MVFYNKNTDSLQKLNGNLRQKQLRKTESTTILEVEKNMLGMENSLDLKTKNTEEIN